jgi:signal transduction histidine kinase
MRDHSLPDGALFDDTAATPATDREANIHLRTAAERLIAAWSNDVFDAGTETELREDLHALLLDLERPEADPEGGALDTSSAVVRRRVLELLRSELIQVWTAADPPPPPSELLEVMWAFERARLRLEPDWDDYFASRLVGPGGLDLVVEVAHDLRSPLTSILFLAETLRAGQSGAINEAQRRQLGIIYSAALGLVSVASDMIELARGGTQLMDREATSFSVSGILESVRDIVLPMAEEKGLSLDLASPEPDQRRGYPVALSRVLLNLTGNALKFTEEGHIEIGARAVAAERVEFSVRDTGRGLAEDELRSLFQPFRRRKMRSGHAFSGSGLGLMISRRLVAAMGSELQVETRSGWGTRFYFDLELPRATSG